MFLLLALEDCWDVFMINRSVIRVETFTSDHQRPEERWREKNYKSLCNNRHTTHSAPCSSTHRLVCWWLPFFYKKNLCLCFNLHSRVNRGLGARWEREGGRIRKRRRVRIWSWVACRSTCKAIYKSIHILSTHTDNEISIWFEDVWIFCSNMFVEDSYNKRFTLFPCFKMCWWNVLFVPLHDSFQCVVLKPECKYLYEIWWWWRSVVK